MAFAPGRLMLFPPVDAEGHRRRHGHPRVPRAGTGRGCGRADGSGRRPAWSPSTSVEPVARESLTDAERARAPGSAGLDELLELVDGERTGAIYRIDLHLAGPDPRVALRESAPDDAEVADPRPCSAASTEPAGTGRGPRRCCRAIASGPGVRAVELAAAIRPERDPFKLDVRKLKELGLTESLQPGLSAVATRSAVLAHSSVRCALGDPASTIDPDRCR